MNKKIWGYAIATTVTLGLSGCYMMDQQYGGSDDYRVRNESIKTHKVKNEAPVSQHGKKVVQQGSSSEVAQKSTPGPKRTAAPQLPVIQ